MGQGAITSVFKITNEKYTHESNICNHTSKHQSPSF